MNDLLLVKKGPCLWPAIVLHSSDIPQHIKLKSKGRQVVKFFNTKRSIQYGISPFKMTRPFDKNVDVNDFPRGSKLFKAYVDALAYVSEKDNSQALCLEPEAKKSKKISCVEMDALPDNVLLRILSHFNWRIRLKLETVSKRWNGILLGNKSLRMIGTVDLAYFVKDSMASQLPQIIESLVVKRNKIIESLVAANTNPISTVVILQMVVTCQPQYLTKLEIEFMESAALTNIVPLVNLLINLQNLKLHMQDEFNEPIDLSQLVNLKDLYGHHIHYQNCRSQLYKLEYRYVKLNTLNDCIDFKQMLLVAEQSLDHLELLGVKLNTDKHNIPSTTLMLPRLTRLIVFESSLYGLTIDLVQSIIIKCIDVKCSTNCEVINLDLSMHSIVECILDSVLTDKFLACVAAYPAGLCLLEELNIDFNTFDSLFAFINCFSSFGTYKLRAFQVSDDDSNPGVLLDSTPLIHLFKCCPLLSKFYTWIDIGKQCLIDLLIGSFSFDCDLQIELGYPIFDSTNTEFIDDLLTALSSIDCSNIRRTVFLGLEVFDEEDEDSDDLDKLKDDYGIIIRSGSLFSIVGF